MEEDEFKNKYYTDEVEEEKLKSTFITYYNSGTMINKYYHPY